VQPLMENFSPSDIALDYGYYQPTDDAGLRIVAAIALLVAVIVVSVP
jgi:hypothetical protein